MRARIALALVAAALLPCLPGEAAADYLYSAFREASDEPYVMLILDNSGSMSYVRGGEPGSATDSYRENGITVCPYGSRDSDTIDCNCREECITTGPACWLPWNWRRVCDQCEVEVCKTRGDAAKEVVSDLVANLDGTELGLIHFNTTTVSSTGCSHGEETHACGRTTVAVPGGGDTRATILSTLSSLPFDTNTPIALSLRDAKTRLQEVAQQDASAACRGYYVILLSDGEDNCCRDPDLEAAALRDISLGGNKTLDVRTFVIGFGKDVAGSAALSAIARKGGTARVDDEWECWDPTGTRTGVPGTCSTGSALFAGDTNALEAALDEVFTAIRSGYFTAMSPVIGSVPQVKSESDRVARNLMAYTAFHMPGYQGRLFGVRLFQEKQVSGKPSGEWEFTDFAKLDLEKCGEAGNPCVFDAGRKLHDRVRSPAAKARTIWTAEVDAVTYQDATGSLSNRSDRGIKLAPKKARLALTKDAAGAGALQQAASALLAKEPFQTLWDDRAKSSGIRSINSSYPGRMEALTESNDGRRGLILSWLHGDPSARPWPLGDPYHGGATIAEAPPYPYRTRGYPFFRDNLRARPPMIYVPANDGMIHAFHAGPDLERLRDLGREQPRCDALERWCPGDEAWAYLPVSLLARTAVEVLGEAERFFSMDLSCRIDDVLVHDTRQNGEYRCSKDPDDEELCGWRTVLLCGQGWGGNWFVALDVSKPLEPRALWEFTFDDGPNGFGRTWSLPSVAVIERNGWPTWMAVAGNGYNTNLKPYGNGSIHAAYRLLNLPFSGAFAHHGNGTAGDADHVYAFDLKDARMIKRFDTSLGSVVADIPAVDVDLDGFTEVAYVSGWNGEIHRLSFGGEDAREAAHPDDWTACDKIFKFSGANPVPNRPVVMLDPAQASRLYVVAASGRDKGSFPDDATNLNASYDLEGWYVDDTGGTACGSISSPKGNLGGSGNMCKDSSGMTMNGLFNQGEGKRRLMGAPIIAGQTNGERWLTFTTWDPPRATCGGDGVGSLYCLKWSTDPESCDYCGDLNGDDLVNDDDESLLISHEIPPPPISADGQIYVASETGLQRVNNKDGKGGIGSGAPNPNGNAPRNVVVSWREVFPSPVAAE